LAFAVQSPRHNRCDDERDDADRFTQRMRADDDRKMLEQTVEVNERRECEQHGGDQRERLVPHVVPSLERPSPYSSLTGAGNQARKSSSDKGSVSSTNSRPNA